MVTSVNSTSPLQILRNRRELLQHCLEIRRDVGGNHAELVRTNPQHVGRFSAELVTLTLAIRHGFPKAPHADRQRVGDRRVA